MKKILLIKFMLCLCIVTTAVFARSNDKTQPMKIEADSVSIDEKKGESHYQGNVVFKQGTIELSADQVIIYSNQKRQIFRVKATGSPSKFKQLPDGSKDFIYGESNNMDYMVAKEKLFLTNNALVKQGKNIFKSQKIEFDSHHSKLVAGEKSSNKSRVQVILQPVLKEK
ncbi:MAG: lipopolysaccharide transport periplasmic protein LptA [Methylococcales bacterium]|jgi:lipopolysaccharide export system protein LptA|nr:lipopolysaccharide transport periplasmic protein LptA [Methylococcales bacterium]MBT7410491.1 lipopolysaccharide transport periplasmic protein LptA [Methylococcales bacterium]